MMLIITMIIIIAAAPPDPMIGILKVSSESMKEAAIPPVRGSDSTVLRTKIDSLNFSFSSFQCCSIICIRWLEKWTTLVSPDWMRMELQLMREDLREQPSGRRSLVLEEIIHCFEGFEALERQVSVTVKLSFS